MPLYKSYRLVSRSVRAAVARHPIHLISLHIYYLSLLWQRPYSRRQAKLLNSAIENSSPIAIRSSPMYYPGEKSLTGESGSLLMNAVIVRKFDAMWVREHGSPRNGSSL